MIVFTNDEMNKITDNVWLGNYESSIHIDNLKKEGIKKILTIMDYKPPIYKEEDNIKQKVISVTDTPIENIIRYFGECINFIDGEEKILVHCMSGASRSASFVIAYLMWKEKKSFKDILDFVSNKRSSVFPNDGFKDQLKLFEKLLKENDYDLNKINFNEIKWNKKLNDYNWNL